MHRKFLKLNSLALLQIVILGNLQIVPANAVYGLSLPFLFFLAMACFYLPCVFMVAELTTSDPQTGGAYIWCEKAFGAKAGFVAVCLLWISNLLWYPSLFSLVVSNFAYLFNPELAQSKIFIMTLSLILFWGFTILNCKGVKISSELSVMFGVIGIIFPLILIVSCGIHWWLSSQPIQLSTSSTPWLPNMFHMDNMGYLISIVMTMFGIELTAVHAGNVVNPKRTYPLSLLISSVVTLTLLLLAALTISAIIPRNHLSIVTGLLDSLVIFLQQVNLEKYKFLILLFVFLGNIGSVAAWMLGSTRGVAVAAQHNHVASFLQKTNKQEAPVGVLVFEAIIFSLAICVFLLFSQVANTFWLLLDLASQITLIYYTILFISAIRLRNRSKAKNGFQVPGGKIIFAGMMMLGAITSITCLGVGFIPPSGLNAYEVNLFHTIMYTGLIIALVLPFIFLGLKTGRRTV